MSPLTSWLLLCLLQRGAPLLMLLHLLMLLLLLFLLSATLLSTHLQWFHLLLKTRQSHH
jgi:hypothetical protein